jgi:hypothetical protein
VTVRVAEIPPPEADCPSDADIERLAQLLPECPDPVEMIAIEELAGRFIDAAAYCEMADRRLR